MKNINPMEIKDNIIELIGKESMLIAAGNKDKYNMMTASWGFMGEMWAAPTVAVVVRPQRYTMEFLNNNDLFTLSFLGNNPEVYKTCGTMSGRDVNKAELTGLTASFSEGAPVFEQSRLTIVCQKQYVQHMEESCFTDSAPLKWYPEKDYHYIVMGKILKVIEE